MSTENQNPNQPYVPRTQPPPPGQDPSVDMGSRWIMWVLSAVVLPTLGWFVAAIFKATDFSVVAVFTILALLCQFITSMTVAQGLCARRGSGAGAAFGLTVVFFVASVAIGTAVWFAGCLVLFSSGSFH